MYGPELVFEIFHFEWKHVFTFLLGLHRKPKLKKDLVFSFVRQMQACVLRYLYYATRQDYSTFSKAIFSSSEICDSCYQNSDYTKDSVDSSAELHRFDDINKE